MRVESRMVVGIALGLGLRVSLKILVRTQDQLVVCRDATALAQGFGVRVRVSSTVSARIWVRVTVGRRVCLKTCV